MHLVFPGFLPPHSVIILSFYLLLLGQESNSDGNTDKINFPGEYMYM